MTSSQTLAPRSTATLETVQEILGALVTRCRADEVSPTGQVSAPAGLGDKGIV